MICVARDAASPMITWTSGPSMTRAARGSAATVVPSACCASASYCVWRIGTAKNSKCERRHVYFDILGLVDVADQKRRKTEFACAVTQGFILSCERSSQRVTVDENELAGMLPLQFVVMFGEVLTLLFQHIDSNNSRTVTRNVSLVIQADTSGFTVIEEGFFRPGSLPLLMKHS